VADSSSCRHLSQVGSSISPSLKRCPLRWQCPVSNPTTHLSWSLSSLNRSFVRLAEGPDINPLACLSPVVDSQCFFYDSYLSSPWPLSWQLQLRYRKLVQVIWTDFQILFLLADLPFHCHQYPHELTSISLNSVMFSQLYEGLVAVPNQFWSDLVFTKYYKPL
jgi:hypothetical protein